MQIEDLILLSRSLTLEEKQELLKKLDILPKETKEKLGEILQREIDALKKIDNLALSAVADFSKDLQTITATVPA